MPKKYSDEYKKMVLEEVENVDSVSKIAKKYRLSTSLVYKWKKLNNEDEHVQLKFNQEDIEEQKTDSNVECIINENLQLKDLVLKKEIEVQNLRDILRRLI